jgi:hypothetical protein
MATATLRAVGAAWAGEGATCGLIAAIAAALRAWASRAFSERELLSLRFVFIRKSLDSKKLGNCSLCAGATMAN